MRIINLKQIKGKGLKDGLTPQQQDEGAEVKLQARNDDYILNPNYPALDVLGNYERMNADFTQTTDGRYISDMSVPDLETLIENSYLTAGEHLENVHHHAVGFAAINASRNTLIGIMSKAQYAKIIMRDKRQFINNSITTLNNTDTNRELATGLLQRDQGRLHILGAYNINSIKSFLNQRTDLYPQRFHGTHVLSPEERRSTGQFARMVLEGIDGLGVHAAAAQFAQLYAIDRDSCFIAGLP